MSNVFKSKKLIRPSFFQKLFKISPKKNCIIEINNLFSEKNISDVTDEEILTICNLYKVNLQKDFQEDILGFYKNYLEFQLINNVLSDNAKIGLKKIIQLLKLKEDETKVIFEDLTREAYSNVVKKSIENGILDKESEENLLNIQKNLLLPKEVATNIYRDNANTLIIKYVAEAISDQKFSSEEEEGLNLLAKNLRINLSFDKGTKELLEKYKLFWQIDNGNIPTISTDISLQKKENCFFYTNIEWLEQRSVTKRINYGGPALRIKIAKGIYYRAGSIAPQVIREDVWKNIDSGMLYLTSKRIIFMGTKGNKTITLNKILDFNVYSNGIEIQKDSGKSPFLSFSKNTDIFSVILSKLLMDK